MGHTHSSVHLLDPDEAPGPIRLYNPKWSVALSGSSNSLVRHLQRCARADIPGPCVRLGGFVASYQFIVENWIEWLLPNLLVGVAGYLLRDLVYSAVARFPFFLQYFFVEAAFGLFLTFLMIFRGLLLFRAQRYHTAQPSLSLQGALIAVKMSVVGDEAAERNVPVLLSQR